ncbi:MAG: hypothetical protein SFU25_03365 [Candidatus Caenarcaniphilales bacterium]|nr:hypothetical protein [Candidatus Caenarcaniphilales bacterium]
MKENYPFKFEYPLILKDLSFISKLYMLTFYTKPFSETKKHDGFIDLYVHFKNFKDEVLIKEKVLIESFKRYLKELLEIMQNKIGETEFIFHYYAPETYETEKQSSLKIKVDNSAINAKVYLMDRYKKYDYEFELSEAELYEFINSTKEFLQVSA